ncbi:2OG-Fe(II) oxygenase superfamily protein [Aureococcus anophagefferens]|uniref:2OG-Fe(II) oxygenase superfamily protein n=1 Tax=Aureococcus anophagefferens TaxID=44056 RepID=A0ABR1G6E7_AURAN
MVLRMLVVATCAHAWLLENSTFWRSPQSEEPMWKRMLRTTSPRRRGVILWAHGRSATDTYCGTLKDSAHFRYCNGIKGGLQHEPPRGPGADEGAPQALRGAERDARRVKPSHLSPEDKRDHLNTPEKLMRAAREFGYEVIVAEYARERARAWSRRGR